MSDRRAKKWAVRKRFPNAYCDNDSGVFVIYLEPGSRRFVESEQSAVDAWKLAYEKLQEMDK